MSYTVPKTIKLYIISQNIPLRISTPLDLTLLLTVAYILSKYVFGCYICSFDLILFPILVVLNSKIFQDSPKKYVLLTSNFDFQ